MKNYASQVCIIGAGPSGVVCSLFLSKFRIPHILIDKSAFPRDKVCGESFDGRVSRILNELSPSFLTEMRGQGIVQHTWDYSLTVKRFFLPISFPKSNIPKLIAKRLVFDKFLLQKALASPYVTPLIEHHVKKLIDNPEKIQVIGDGFAIDTSLAILANGAQNAVGKASPKQKKEDSLLFVRGYYDGVKPKENQEIEIYLLSKPTPVCLYMCPLPNGEYNVEIGLLKKDYKAIGKTKEVLIEECIQEVDGLAKRFANAKLNGGLKGTFMPVDNQIAASAKNRLIYTGANVFSVNPVTGLGVGNAMTMGKLAALQAKSCVEKDRFDSEMTQQYDLAVRKRLENIVRLNKTINFIQKHPALFGWVFYLPFLAPVLKSLLNNAKFIDRFALPAFYKNMLNRRKRWVIRVEGVLKLVAKRF